MRITTGYLKGRNLGMPKDIRPTQDKVRKAIFDILQGQMQGSRFLDLCAGSAAVGIEAVSNGCSKLVVVEKDSQCLKVIIENLNAVGLGIKSNIVSILSFDALRAIENLYKKGEAFDFIFLDPPYEEDTAKKILQKLSLCDILAPHGLIVVEHSDKNDSLDEGLSGITCCKQKGYGDTVLSFYEKMVSRQ